MAVYFPFALYPQVLLSETLFLTLLLGGFLALARWSAKNTSGQWSVVCGLWSVIAGVLFGLATLTRSLTLFFLPIVTLWLLTRRPTTDDRRPTASRFTFHSSRFSVLGSFITVP
jgi:4-amino-4-deoxy-L-arabinose transferase-like glycosyltransferase